MFLTPQTPPGAPPARPSLRTLLTHLITAALIAASLVVAAAAPSHAAPGHHTPVTWNMLGAFTDRGESKWTSTVRRLSGGGENYLPHDVVALQEAGPRGSLPGTVVRSGSIANIGGRRTTYDYEVRRWRLGSTTRGRDVYITWLNTDPTGNRNNVAFVTHEDPGTPAAVAARQANNRDWGMRPALGIRLNDGSWFWSFHASSNGDNRSNDAQNMLVEIQSASSPGLWAVLGDFNRRPDNITVPPGSQIYASGEGTQDGGGELDYMVSNDRQNMQGWTGRRLDGGGSDHLPVEFTLRAASSEYKVQYGKDRRKCLNVRYDQSVDVQGVCDDNGVEDFQFSGQRFLEVVSTFDRDNYCLDVYRGGTTNGTPVIGYSCESGGGANQQFHLTGDSTIVGVQSGKCLEVDSNEKLIINECDSSKPEQTWAVRSVSPYKYGYLSRIGPATGTEDAETGGSGTQDPLDPDSDPDSGSCPMPPNPELDPCHHISKRSTTDVPISDHATVESSITVSGISGNAPANLGVGVDIEHTFRGDLIISLVGPSGREYLLEDIPDDDSSDHVFRSYTLDASSERANGTWTLRVRDTGSGDTGKIDAWNLTFPASSTATSGGGYFENPDDVPILDNRSNDSRITVSGISGNAPSSLAVGVDIKHTYRGDLAISLVGPSGKAYLLEDFDNSDAGDDVNKTYVVDASSEPANGTWTLRVNDFGDGDTGKIDTWHLTFDEPFAPQSLTEDDSGSGTCFTPGGSPIPC